MSVVWRPAATLNTDQQQDLVAAIDSRVHPSLIIDELPEKNAAPYFAIAIRTLAVRAAPATKVDSLFAMRRKRPPQPILPTGPLLPDQPIAR
jgi:hypothetical protein